MTMISCQTTGSSFILVCRCHRSSRGLAGGDNVVLLDGDEDVRAAGGGGGGDCKDEEAGQFERPLRGEITVPSEWRRDMGFCGSGVNRGSGAQGSLRYTVVGQRRVSIRHRGVPLFSCWEKRTNGSREGDAMPS